EIQIARILCVLAYMLGIGGIPAGEKDLLLPVNGSLFIIECIPGQKRSVAVLLAFEITDKSFNRFRIVFIDGRIGGRTNKDEGIGRVADENHRIAYRNYISQSVIILMGIVDGTHD